MGIYYYCHRCSTPVTYSTSNGGCDTHVCPPNIVEAYLVRLGLKLRALATRRVVSGVWRDWLGPLA